MHAVAAQERTRMLSRGMTDSGIRIGAVPRQDGGAIDNQITRPDQPTAQSRQDAQDEERLGSRRSGGPATLALLRGTGNARSAIVPQRQAACQGKGGPS